MTCRRTAALLIAVAALVAPAAPASAHSARTVLNAHLSGSWVAGGLPAGAGITVIHHCPVGGDLDRAATRAFGEFHEDDQVRVHSRAYWPAGAVTRYRVRKPLSEEGAELMTAAFCTSRVAARATRFAAKAKVDVRVWGPAPADVVVANTTMVAVTDSMRGLRAGRQFRTALVAAGVDSHPAGVRGAMEAAQDAFVVHDDTAVVVAMGETDRRIGRGTFVSMRNNYRFIADLGKLENR